jgi:hypothetical protein
MSKTKQVSHTLSLVLSQLNKTDAKTKYVRTYGVSSDVTFSQAPETITILLKRQKSSQGVSLCLAVANDVDNILAI